MMRAKLKVLAAVCLAVIFTTPLAGCGKPQTSNRQYSEDTQLYYQVLDGYKAAVIDRDFIGDLPQVTAWLDVVSAGAETQGYYEYIYADADSWDMFIFWPRQHMDDDLVPDFDTLRFSIEDGTVQLRFDSGGTGSAEILLLIQAPQYGPWPSASAVYIDDVEVMPRVILDW